MKQLRCAGCREFFCKDELKIIFGMSRFCSYECAYNPRKRQKKPKQKEQPKFDRQEVLKADGQRCRMCGRTSSLHVHHVRYRSEGIDNTLLNLITLCDEDHARVHKDKARYQPLCRGIIWLRTMYGDKGTLIPDLERQMKDNPASLFWRRPRKE